VASMTPSLALLAVLLPLSASAQIPSLVTGDQAVVVFNFEWNEGAPWQSYSIQVQADGQTHFEGTPNPSQRGATGPVKEDFVISEANRREIFDAAQKLNYFQGNFDSHLKHIAQTGTKTLEYKSANTHGSSTYNYSQNPTVQSLTKLFLGLATTIDFGHKLAWQYRYDKLGLDQQLRELEELQAGHQVEELFVIEPILRKIADDPNVMHISRLSAQHLLKASGAQSVAPHSAADP